MASFETLISRRLDTAGDGSGEINAVGDYSSEPTEFCLAPSSNETFVIARLIVGIGDAGSMDAGMYGNDVTLRNGIHIVASDAWLTDPNFPIRTNAHWACYCYDMQRLSWGSGLNYVIARWTFTKSEQPLQLHGSVGDRFIVVLNDDFRPLAHHSFVVQGYKRER